MKRQSFLVLVITLLLGAALLVISCGAAGGRLSVTDLRCEYLQNPLGIDMPHPRFSWEMTSSRRGVTQSAYRILVASSPDNLQIDSADLWDSGKQSSDDAVNIPYEGENLESGTAYYWKVRIWDQAGDATRWSEVASFHTGLLTASDWTGQWIAAGDTSISAPLLRKGFQVDKRVQQATAYVTGLGNYEFYLNGKKVSADLLIPAMTDFSKRVLYNTYDVTDQVTSGHNVAGILLGNGAFRLEGTPGRYGWHGNAHYFGPPCALLQLDITFTDGSSQTVVTDASWRSTAGPITYNHFYGGEDYDARREESGWSTSDFDAAGWQPVTVVNAPPGILDAQLMPASRVIRTIQPLTSTHPEPGVYVFDLGQNIPGWWRIRVEGDPGVQIRVRAAETLNDSLFPEPLKDGDRISTNERYHANVWTTYTAKGDGEEQYEPHFFYTGFRYLEATVDNPDALQSLEAEGRVVHTTLQRNGSFSTSDSLLNKVHRAAIWAQIGNTHDYPTDCPQREKGAYTGDGEIIAESSMHDFHMAAFYTKWLNDMQDSQEDNGRIPNTAPTLVGGMGGGIPWGSAYILLPWWMYNYYTDARVMEEHYPTMQRYIQYLHRLARTDSNPREAYIINDFSGYWYSLGEWCAPGQSDGPNHPVVSTYYYYLDTFLMSKIAGVLGYSDDAKAYAALADSVRQAFVAKFYDPETNYFGTQDAPYQTYQLLALSGNVVPEGDYEDVLQTVLDDITDTHDGHLNTGIIGTKYLWPVLVESGHGDVAYTVATQKTYPSYGYWIEKGATTLWEKWSGENSHNHEMFGTIEEYFYKYLAGIRAPGGDDASRGYRQIHIRPEAPAGLSEARASVETVAGTVASHWQQKPNVFRLTVSIPANSTGMVSVPLRGLSDVVISEGRTTVWENNQFRPDAEGVNSASSDEESVTFQVGSGNYVFTVVGSQPAQD